MKQFMLVLCCMSLVWTAFAQKISGEGNIVKKEISLPEFTSIGLGIPAEVYLTQGNTQKVIIEAQQNIIDNIERNVKGNSWNIEYDKDVRTSKDVKIYITMKTIEALSIGGSGSIVTESSFDNLDDVKISIGGSGDVTLKGSGKSTKISIGGSGSVMAEDFQVNQCKVSIGGSGKAYVYANDNLDVSIAGSGDVRYKGKPAVRSSIAGSGDVSQL